MKTQIKYLKRTNGRLRRENAKLKSDLDTCIETMGSIINDFGGDLYEEEAIEIWGRVFATLKELNRIKY